MTRPTFEVADILRAQGDRFLDRYRSGFDFQQLKAFRAILRCRTAALGGHRDACPSCGHQAISYNSCRNRHCPKCQTQARERWLAARERELLTTSYFHVVFTVPHELNVLALENPRLFYDLLFAASAQTLLEIAIDRKHLGAEIGMISILHTWGQNLLLHPHIHCAIPAGGLSPDRRQWVRPRCTVATSYVATVPPPLWPIRSSSQNSCAVCTVTTGLSMPSPPSADPCRCCATSAVTPIAWPFPIIAYWPSTKNASPFAGRITPTAASMAR